MGRYDEQERKRQERDMARQQTARFLAEVNDQRKARNVSPVDWDITDVETGRSARYRPRPWHEIEESFDADEASRICIWCGDVLPTQEALDEHEADCEP